MTTSIKIRFGRSMSIICSRRMGSCTETDMYPARSRTDCISLTSAGESSTIRILVKTDKLPRQVLQLRSQAGWLAVESQEVSKLFIIRRLETTKIGFTTTSCSYETAYLSHPETNSQTCSAFHRCRGKADAPYPAFSQSAIKDRRRLVVAARLTAASMSLASFAASTWLFISST